MSESKTSKNYVVFSQVKAQVSIKQVLEHYGLTDDMTEKGSDLLGYCPIHQGTNPTAFKANLSKNIFYCFGCKAGGNILDFVSSMEKVNIRESALLLADWFNIKSNGAGERGKTAQGDKKTSSGNKRTANPPLKFSGLKSLETTHPFFIEAGFSPETLKHFGAGYFSRKGLMKGRLAVPIRTTDNVLVAYAGRKLTQAPDWKFPKRFRPELELYNIERQVESGDSTPDVLYIVHEPLDVWRLYQAGISKSVALLGGEPSPEQVKILLSTLTPGAKVACVIEETQDTICLITLSQMFFTHLIQIPKPLWQFKPGEVENLLN